MNWLNTVTGIASASILTVHSLQPEPPARPWEPARPAQPAQPADQDPGRIIRPVEEQPLERSPEWNEGDVVRPGKHHEILEPIIGEWTALVTIYRDGSEHESRGTLRNEWVLGDRFIRGAFTGDEENGEPREGISFLGYNNAADRYEAMWVDTGSTEIMRATGHLEPATGVLTLHGKHTCTMTGAEIPTRIVARMETPDRIIYEMFEKPPEQREHKSMEIIYTRREGAEQDPARAPANP